MNTALLHYRSIEACKRKSRSGIALLLVIPTVAMAAVLSYAVLANVGMQNQIMANAQYLAQADCLAESGINYAMYELQQSVTSQNPAPSIPSGPISLGNPLGSFSLLISGPTGTNPVMYVITSTGTIPNMTNSSNQISRQITVSVQIPLVASSQSSGPGLGHGHGTGTGGHASGSGSITGGSSGSNQTLLIPQNVQAMRWSQ